jgi:hypothetical protein
MAEARQFNHANTSLAAGAFYVYGAGGDVDPVYVLEDVVVTVVGTTPVRVGHSLTDILAGRYTQVEEGGQPGSSQTFAGPLDNLIIYNPEAATAASYTVTATGRQRNSGQDAGVLCQQGYSGATTRYQVIRCSKVAGATTETTVPVKYRRTLTAIKGYSVTVASGATLSVDLLDSRDRSLLAAVMNPESHTTKTIYTSTSLTASTDLRTIARGDDMVISFASSAGGDTVGDALIEIAHTVA